MPPAPRPSPLFGWLCVVQSAAEILSHAARIRAEQAARASTCLTERHRNGGTLKPSDKLDATPAVNEARILEEAVVLPSDGRTSQQEPAHPSPPPQDAKEPIPVEIRGTSLANEVPLGPSVLSQNTRMDTVDPTSLPETNQSRDLTANQLQTNPISDQPPSLPLGNSDTLLQGTKAEPILEAPKTLHASRVPSSRIGRLFHYGGLAAGLGYGAAAEVLRRTGGGGSSGNVMMTPANISRLVEKLSRMRGAALKVGQFLSIQDTHVLPKDVEEVFRRVQDSAHYMPHSQLEEVMRSALGDDWSSYFSEFSPIPFAAASLGQVHSGVLAANVSPTGKEEKVAIKVQFPNISRSIESDLGYLTWVLSIGRVLPKGLFLDKTIQVMRQELHDECDYEKEAAAATFFGSPEGLGRDPRYRVPWIWYRSTERVLVMQKMDGISVGSTTVETLPQPERDEIARRVLELCLKELFTFRMMQTDPNWSNFLWNGATRQVELIDFGATRSYSQHFMDRWMHLLQSAVAENFDACEKWSEELGYLTGAESDAMRSAHVKSVTLLATPFRTSGRLYDFGKGSEWSRITAEIRSLIPVMLQERLTPPPRETYSLNRKLSGAFLLASRLNAKVDAGKIWNSALKGYKFES